MCLTEHVFTVPCKTHGAHKEQAQVVQASTQKSRFWATSWLLLDRVPSKLVETPGIRHNAERGMEEG